MSGFRNCMSIKKYAPGMTFTINDGMYCGTWTVYHVNHNGGAYCVTESGLAEVFGEATMERADLDLMSVWIGREYQRDGTMAGTMIMVVRAVSPGHIGFRESGKGDDSGYCWNRKDFIEHYKPVPLPPAPPLPPCRVSCGEFVLIDGDKAGKVLKIDEGQRRFQVSGHGWFPFNTAVTKLVPEKPHE